MCSPVDPNYGVIFSNNRITYFEKYILNNGFVYTGGYFDLMIGKKMKVYINELDNSKIILFCDSKLINPLPTIKQGYKIKTDHESITKAINKYSYESVIESMFNPKVILTL